MTIVPDKSGNNPIVDASLSDIASGFQLTQNVLSTSAELVIAANSSRRFVEVKNPDASINVYLGDDADVTSTNGHVLRPGEAFGFDDYVGPIWMVAASGTPTITTIEW